MHDGVYRHAAVPLTPEAEIRAAVLAGGRSAWASGRSAMRLYGCRSELVRSTRDHTPRRLSTSCCRVSTVRRIDRIEDRDHCRRFGIPVLAPPLALLLLGARRARSVGFMLLCTTSSSKGLYGQAALYRRTRVVCRARPAGYGQLSQGRGVARPARTCQPDEPGARSREVARRATGSPEPHLQLPVERRGWHKAQARPRLPRAAPRSSRPTAIAGISISYDRTG